MGHVGTSWPDGSMRLQRSQDSSGMSVAIIHRVLPFSRTRMLHSRCECFAPFTACQTWTVVGAAEPSTVIGVG